MWANNSLKISGTVTTQTKTQKKRGHSHNAETPFYMVPMTRIELVQGQAAAGAIRPAGFAQSLHPGRLLK